AAEYQEAAKVFSQLGAPARERDAWDRRGDLFFGDSEWQEAREAYEKALPLDRTLKDLRDEAWVEGQLGRCAEESEVLKEAEVAYRRALDIWRQIGDRESEATEWTNLGHVFSKRGEIWES